MGSCRTKSTARIVSGSMALVQLTFGGDASSLVVVGIIWQSSQSLRLPAQGFKVVACAFETRSFRRIAFVLRVLNPT